MFWLHRPYSIETERVNAAAKAENARARFRTAMSRLPLLELEFSDEQVFGLAEKK